MTTRPRVLFVCIGNMCRSPMAEGFARARGADVVVPSSAGTHATGRVSDDAIEVMAELGIDIEAQTSDHIRTVDFDEIDMVVAMGGEPARNLVPPGYRGTLVDWDVDDPVAMSLTKFRQVRDQLDQLVQELLLDLKKRQA